jgi:hypothetical protein
MRIRIIKENEKQDLKNLLKMDYSLFVKELGDNIKDPKFIAAIKSLSDKYPLNFSSVNPTVGDLKPTQNEIDIDKSLKFPLTNADSARICLKGGIIAVAGKRIITGGGGKFIIDGHHRWSQVCALNPEAKIAAIDLSDIKNPIKALKATQLGIAADLGEVPTATVEGSNLLKIGKDALRVYIVKTITPKIVQVFIAKGIGKGRSVFAKIAAKTKPLQEAPDQSTKLAIANYIWKNVEQMQQKNQPVPGAPERGIMPQTDDAKDWQDLAPNINNIKEEIARLKKLAGL